MAAITWVLAAISLSLAIANQSQASKPIGEGDVFVADAEAALATISAAPSPAEGVRHARNDLGIESVSLLSGDALVIASTSETLLGKQISNPLLGFGASNRRFAALAVAVETPIEIDGVIEWESGSILYQVVSPIPDSSRAMLLHYDVSELLGRRVQPGEIHPLTIQLLALGGIFGILGAAVMIGHARVSRRHREMAVESELLREQSGKLQSANASLAEARRAAEQALALAEEKMRIRSDFVLMINHELRTPLTTVVTGAELVRDGRLSLRERTEVLDSMVAHGERLKEIIDQILAVARIENRGLSYDLDRVSIEEVCAATDATPGDDVTGIIVQTDLRTLALVVASLADNARTHGATNVEVLCATESLGNVMFEVGNPPVNAVYLNVIDDGPGIDLEFLPRAFEKFEKNSSSSGTGLGLYMVRLMVEALGGSVAVRTTTSGTTFQLALPATTRDRIMEAV